MNDLTILLLIIYSSVFYHTLKKLTNAWIPLKAVYDRKE